DRHVGDRGGAGVDPAAGQQQQGRGEQDGVAHGVSPCGYRDVLPKAALRGHMLRNRAMNGWLTGSVSGRCLSRIVPRPLSSRLIEAIALRLTMVERWTCLNSAGSSRPSSSRIGVRSSASPSAVITVVYLLSARK